MINTVTISLEKYNELEFIKKSYLENKTPVVISVNGEEKKYLFLEIPEAVKEIEEELDLAISAFKDNENTLNEKIESITKDNLVKKLMTHEIKIQNTWFGRHVFWAKRKKEITQEEIKELIEEI
ncbi:hypothetical protein [Flavobacterium capsici]|uniref:Uncharacterized protein n=1 Tax=Flavobacterium capsici TaxID=3075618 RepID=A0AA96F0G5_9FLAO|nr:MULTISPECIES: hypothetical protein [unclassified Flavobacterium]WNM19259.1 hypothetical protein RN608_00920 [Flavobacterium sp. PMR2A8]WNM20648.1 hypothetical protein RN605_08090 [Flavobacterium sp. PMTSA4]